MSTRFLHVLENRENRHLSAFIANLGHDARIAWYPSAGTDFRPLFFMDEAFHAQHPPDGGSDPLPPDIFLYTDYCLMNKDFENALFNEGNPVIFEDGRTKVTLKDIENLGRIDFPAYPPFREDESNTHYFNRVFFFNAIIESKQFGVIQKPVLYAFCYNEQLCAELLLPVRAIISHVIHVRYGHGFGGANCSGMWIQHVLPLLQCEVYVHDAMAHDSESERIVIRHYGNVIPQQHIAQFKTIREIDGRSWSDSTRVIWQLVEQDKNIYLKYHYNHELRGMKHRSCMIFREQRMYNFLV